MLRLPGVAGRAVAALFVTLLLSVTILNAQPLKNDGGLDTVKAGKFDTGRMWTFDYPPTKYFSEAYNFTPTEEWYSNVRMSALRFSSYCSASFVSGDGLVMTNHHCGRESITGVTKEGEDLHKDGFWAPTLEDERKVPGLYVDQLVHIEDVTKQVQDAIDAGKNDAEKLELKNKIIKELQDNLKKDKKLQAQVITMFNGGKYSLYGFKRYNDVRLVFAPESQLGFFGGDPDNFTYPRYNLDATFFRVYDEDGKPLKTDHFFKWSTKGAMVNEPVFVVGNPGSTNRLYTVAQLEFQRDYQHPMILQMLKGISAAYSEVLAKNPDRALELQDQIFSFENSRKAYGGILGGLQNPVLMKKKLDWQNSFRAAVDAKPELRKKYGDLWDKIADTRAEISEFFNYFNAISVRPLAFPQYFVLASQIVDLAKNLEMDADDRDAKYKNKTDEDLKNFLMPSEIDTDLANATLKQTIVYLEFALGKDSKLLNELTGGKKGDAAVEYILGRSVFSNMDQVKELLAKGHKAVLESKDPFIVYLVKTYEDMKEMRVKLKSLSEQESDYVQQLGRAVFEVYGTSIPPDATFSLRISDGVVKGYEYNGTKAPAVTTFYGLYDRFYSHDQQFPWNLPEKWINPPAEFDLEVPFNFVSTNDIIGGNSGSPVINKNAEVVGLAFDGNIESLPGQFIFDETANRTVSVHSAGMLEAIADLYKATRLANELKNGKLD